MRSYVIILLLVLVLPIFGLMVFGQDSVGFGDGEEKIDPEILTEKLASGSDFTGMTSTDTTANPEQGNVANAEIPANTEVRNVGGDFTAERANRLDTRSGTSFRDSGLTSIQSDGSWQTNIASSISDADARLTSPSKATGNNNELTAQQAKHISITNKLTASNIKNFHYDKIINTITFDSADNVHLFHPLPMSFPSLGKTTLTFNGNTLTEFTTDVLNTITLPHPFNDVPSPDYLQFKDSDGDGLVDEIETLNNLNPNNPDSDNDGISDYDEFTRYPTNPNDANTYGQTDSQALDDIRAGTLVLGQNQGSTIADLGLTPFTAFQDSDGDGLSDWKEFSLGTDRNNPDSDGDGLTDGYELTHALGPRETTSMFVPQERVQELIGTGKFTLDLSEYNGNTPTSKFTQQFNGIITTRNGNNIVQETNATKATYTKLTKSKERHTFTNAVQIYKTEDYQDYIAGKDIEITTINTIPSQITLKTSPSIYIYDVFDNQKYYYHEITGVEVRGEDVKHYIWDKKNPAVSFGIARSTPGPYTIAFIREGAITKTDGDAVINFIEHTATLQGIFKYQRKHFTTNKDTITESITYNTIQGANTIASQTVPATFLHTVAENRFYTLIASNNKDNVYTLTLDPSNIFIPQLAYTTPSCTTSETLSSIQNTWYTTSERCTPTESVTRHAQYLPEPVSPIIQQYTSLTSKQPIYFEEDYMVQRDTDKETLVVCPTCTIGQDLYTQRRNEYEGRFMCS